MNRPVQANQKPRENGTTHTPTAAQGETPRGSSLQYLQQRAGIGRLHVHQYALRQEDGGRREIHPHRYKGVFKCRDVPKVGRHQLVQIW